MSEQVLTKLCIDVETLVDNRNVQDTTEVTDCSSNQSIGVNDYQLVPNNSNGTNSQSILFISAINSFLHVKSSDVCSITLSTNAGSITINSMCLVITAAQFQQVKVVNTSLTGTLFVKIIVS